MSANRINTHSAKPQTFMLTFAVVIALACFNCGFSGCISSPPEYLGDLHEFAYEYGSFNGGYRRFSITPSDNPDKGGYLLTAEGFNGVDLNVETYINQDDVDTLTSIIKDNNIYAWDGFDRSDYNILDGYSFSLKVVYTESSIIAGGYEKFPSNYKQGHAALSAFLLSLVD
ncbi:MAG: hypothetical protein LBU61_06770 [Coriobacteriales bacterium]|jgi:hypothetical protein|nr:hypothetical protein [Coriobacteriales bacterium]